MPRFPTAILATGIMLSAMLSLVCGAVLHYVTLARQETKRMVYLSIPASRSLVASDNAPTETASFVALGPRQSSAGVAPKQIH